MEFFRLLSVTILSLATASAAQGDASSSPLLIASPSPNTLPLAVALSPGNDDQWATMATLPSEEDGGLRLATRDDTAILECRLMAASFDSIAWINTITNATWLHNSSAEIDNGTEPVVAFEVTEDGTKKLVLRLLNTSIVGETLYKCQATAEGKTGIQKTVTVTFTNSDWLCTFEGKMNCGWEHGQTWRRKQSALRATSGEAKCDSDFSDHTYGKSNAHGHYLAAEVTGENAVPEEATLRRILPRQIEPKCLRFFCRICCRQSNSKGSLIIRIQREPTKPSTSASADLHQTSDQEWTEYSLTIAPYDNDSQITISLEDLSDIYVAIDDIRLENGNCSTDGTTRHLELDAMPSGENKPSTMKSLDVPQSPTSYTTTTSTVSSSTLSTSASSVSTSTSPTSTITTSTTTTTRPSSLSSTSATTTPSTTPAPVVDLATPTPQLMTSSSTSQKSEIRSSVAVTSPSVTSSPLLATTSKTATPDEIDDSVHPTDQEASSSVEDDDSGAPAAEAASDNSTGLAIGIILAIMVAGACTAAILYRRRKNGKKSTYITFGNPSYSREHLPVNDFGLDSPLTLSSNGYTVLA